MKIMSMITVALGLLFSSCSEPETESASNNQNTITKITTTVDTLVSKPQTQAIDTVKTVVVSTPTPTIQQKNSTNNEKITTTNDKIIVDRKKNKKPSADDFYDNLLKEAKEEKELLRQIEFIENGGYSFKPRMSDEESEKRNFLKNRY